MKRKRLFCLLFAVEMLCLFGLTAVAVKESTHSTSIPIEIEEMTSDFGIYEDAWYIDEEILGIEESVDFLYGPYAVVPKGSYTLSVEYTADEEQTFCAFVEGEEGNALRAGYARLSPLKNREEYHLTVEEDTDAFEVLFGYSGKGAFTVHDVTLMTNADATLRRIVLTFAVFLLMDLLFAVHMTKEKWLVLLSLAGITALTSLPLLSEGLVRGADIRFHTMRIESIAQGLRLGQFPVKMNWLYLDGYGYPASIFYGDLLLYIPAVLRLMGFDVVWAYKIFVVLINAATAGIAYACFFRVLCGRVTAVLTAMVYAFSSYRFKDLFGNAAVGEYTAMVFLPVIALAVYCIYTEDTQNWKTYRRWAWVLAVGMSGLLATHVLSTIMTAFCLLLLCLILWRKTFRKQTLRVYLLAVGETLLLSSYFLIPFVDCFLGMKINVQSAVAGKLQENGAQILDYFRLFEASGNGKLVAVTPGLILTAAFVASIVIWIARKATKEMCLLSVVTAFILFLSSSAFPWDRWVEVSYLGRFLAKVQFPSRYLVIAVLYMSLLFGFLMKLLHGKNKRWFWSVLSACVAFSIVWSGYYTVSFDKGRERYLYYDTAQLNHTSIGIGSEYLREGTDIEQLHGELLAENMEEVEYLSRRGTRMELYLRSGEVEATVDVPMFHYKGYRAFAQNGEELQLTDGYNFVIRLNVPAGFDGNVTIDFVQPWYWQMAYGVSILSAAMLWYFHGRKYKKNGLNT